LKESFLELFHIERDRDALVAGLMLAHNDEVHWDMSIIKLVHAWEVDNVSSLLNALYSTRRSWGAEDKCVCVPLKRQYFEVIIFYNVLLPKLTTLSFGRVYEDRRFP
jgi:hypothetical protein